MRSDAILLPGEDLEEFLDLRRDLFSTYQPRTRDEALCVEAVARRCWRQAGYVVGSRSKTPGFVAFCPILSLANAPPANTL